ncbi:MAG: PEP-CTERM sorting domain-containing protein [Planctomycetales bacterium]|nr:PEP-CTERM sorting domain-containing protein [Planctomycetales bacterium]
MKSLCLGLFWGLVAVMPWGVAVAQAPPEALLTPGRSFALQDKIVSTSVFVWYQSAAGQLSGPWEPLGGRPSWTGEVPFWKDQIKQIMSANIDVMNVHLFQAHDSGADSAAQRTNLFQALSELRHEGYEVPKVTPFLDPIITWGTEGLLRFAPQDGPGRDIFVAMYEDFYHQYFSVNTDPQADSYLTRIDGRTALDVWHTHVSIGAYQRLTRADVQTRLQDEFAAEHPIFNDDIYMITTKSDQTLVFADEQVIQFQSQAYLDPTSYNGIRAVQLKPGYWDQNIRDPGFFLPRTGGTSYAGAWQRVAASRESVDRVYIESWNEYDEGSGIYAAEPQPPNIRNPPNDSGNSDAWSGSNDPYEYIKSTANGARQFNDVADMDARILWHNLPETMQPGETVHAQIVVRNTGDISWNGASNFKLGQNENLAATLFGAGRYLIDDDANEIPTYGGIFRGRPIVFDVQLTAPAASGRYVTHWQMLQEHVAWFGEDLAHTIQVGNPIPEPSTLGLLLTGLLAIRQIKFAHTNGSRV